jgi:hypothetical protein
MFKKFKFLILLAVIGLLLACNSPFTTPTPTPPTATPETPTLTPQPTVTSTPDPYADWYPYTSGDCGFKILYPPDGVLTPGEGNIMRINLSVVPDTNLHEKYLEITCAITTDTCVDPQSQGVDPAFIETETRDINGISFTIQSGADAGAGNYYEWTTYSTTREDMCVNLSFILHSTNRLNYPTPPPEFDREAESAIFEEMVSTFTWLEP